MLEVIVKKEGIEGVEFFGKVDRNKEGKIVSETPSWYLRQNKEELEGNIEGLAASLEREQIQPSEKPLAIARLKQMREKLDSIKSAEPNFKDSQKDAIAKVTTSLGEKISSAMFTRTEMMKRTDNAHEEARRMADPCIKLTQDEATLAHKCGMRISRDGQVSRTDAERMWKMGRRSINENSNTEDLRRQQ
jgi:hypothetical protein